MLKHGDFGHRLYIACVDLQLLNLVGLLLHLSMALELLRFSPLKFSQNSLVESISNHISWPLPNLSLVWTCCQVAGHPAPKPDIRALEQILLFLKLR